MKKVILAIVGSVIALYLAYSLVFYSGIYLPVSLHDEITRRFVCDGMKIMQVDERGNRSEFVIKGMNLDNFIPGHNPSEHAIDKDTWLRWFSQMSDMGVNTVRTTNIYNDVFYNALYEYNLDNQSPLYLLQGIEVTEYSNNNSKDAYEYDFYDTLIEEGKMAIDVVHGRRNIQTNTVRGSGVYRKDVSPWVIGYLVGSSWNDGTIEYTNHKEADDTSYQGKYLFTDEGSNAFETMLCKVMDKMVSYESSKYHEQRLISFYNDPVSDPLIYEEGFDLLYSKYTDLDLEKILQKDYSGLFAAYNVYALCDNYDIALSERTRNKLRDLELSNLSPYLYGYLDILVYYHTHPVVVTAFECSTSRGITKGDAPKDEVAQGEYLADAYNSTIASGCCGGFIESWQDSWTRRSFNTSYGLFMDNSQNWYDPQSYSQSKGILAFVPENKWGSVQIDGDLSDFGRAERLPAKGDNKVYYSYDSTFLYMCIKTASDPESSKLYISFDITPNSGSSTFPDEGIYFDRPADFVIVVDGRDNTRLMVQERYDSLRENYLEAITGEDPFENPPAKDTDVFVTVGQLRQKEGLLQDAKDILEIDAILEQKQFDRYDTGRLHYGNGNTSAEDYDSLTDFSFGKDGVEIRIPWTMLNFSDPSQCLIHDDYYENYGREDIRVKEIFIGVGDEEHREIGLSSVELPGWQTNYEYTERLKRSFDIIKQAWRG